MIARLLAIVCLVLAVPASAAPPSNRPTPGYVRVAIETSKGKVIIAVDTRHAPKTSANFLAYVDDGRFDGTTFYRAARRKSDGRFGYVQGGIRTDLRRSLPPIPHEPTRQTGIKHLNATISMARKDRLGSANGNFFITVGATPFMDQQGAYPGYAAFGHVVAGMNVVKRILAMPTSGGTGAMKGQLIDDPVRIIRARRLDGKPRPSGYPKAWLIWEK